MAAIEEKIRIRAEYSVTSKQFNYTLLAIILGVPWGINYVYSDDNQEISGLDKQPVIVEMRENITELQKSVVVYDAMIADDMAKSNTKVIEGILND